MVNPTLQIPFKGDREYLQGPDILDWVVSHLITENTETLKAFEISFHSMATVPLKLFFGDVPGGYVPVVTGYYVGSNGKQRFWLSETDGKIESRVQYSEYKIINNLYFIEKFQEVELTSDTGLSHMETLVSMTKEMHHKNFPEADKKWIFVRARVNMWPYEQTIYKYRVKLVSNLKNVLTRSEVYLNDSKVGDIFFSQI